MAHATNIDWPVLTRYDQRHLRNIALPLGGIGTGTVSLGGRGDLRDWEIMNRPAKGFTPRHTFFALYAKEEGKPAVTRVLEGVLEEEDYVGPYGSRVPNHGLPRFRKCSFAAAYPFGIVHLEDDDVPVRVRVGGFNPLIPGDPEDSGIPAAILKFELTNPKGHVVDCSICGNVENFIGFDGKKGRKLRNRNRFRQGAGMSGIEMTTEGTEPTAEQYGTMSLVVLEDDVSYNLGWRGWAIKHSWSERLINFWDDFSSDGRLEGYPGDGEDAPIASLAASVKLAPGETRTVTFLLTWHFPNRQSWDVLIKPKVERLNTKCCGGGVCRCEAPVRVGNYYATRYADAWEVAERTAARLSELEDRTVRFVQAFVSSSMPDVIKESALYNVSTLRSQTCFRTEDGHFFGWEGCGFGEGSCHGNATHVWNYDVASGYLFGELASSMRDAEFRFGVTEEGLLNHRLMLPLHRGKEFGVAAADGQNGTVMRLYREWKLSGDGEFLARLWPYAKRAVEFNWLPGGWDADEDGVAEGCQHVTYDVEFFGPNPLAGIWYLGALRAAEQMARAMGEPEFADKCRRLYENGAKYIDGKLFNGEYYEQEVRPFDPDRIRPGLQTGEGAITRDDPELQLAHGCLTDQLVGQYIAHTMGLGYLLDPANIRRALASVLKYNHRSNTYDLFNPMRSFVLNDEACLLVCTYPRGERPKFPFPYFSEVMNGMEYAAGVHMLYEGMEDEGLRVLENIRARYDGRKRNPFNEQECGDHYARSLASWGGVLAATGFQFSAVDKSMQFRGSEKDAVYFWSNGYAYGTMKQTEIAGGKEVQVTVLEGELQLERFALSGWGAVRFDSVRRIAAGEPMRFVVGRDAG
jgi:uncharacterized protein (DUF608 family)